jgi:hypothetical protein
MITKRLFQILCTLSLINWSVAAPVSEEGPHKSVSASSFGHLGIKLGLGGAAVFASILGAEWGLHMIKAQQSGTLQRLRNDESRQNQQSHATDEAQREAEAIELLLALAHKHAQKVSAEGFNGKFKPFLVPKEIHQSLESVFNKKHDGSNNLEAYRRLKEKLSPLLDFE